MEESARKTQVVIIGAGPTGLSMAAQLIRHQIDFIILERKESPTTLSKAIAVQARTLEIFQELGIAEEAMQRGQLTTGMNLFYQGKQLVDLDLAGLGEGLSEFAFALSLEQSKTEQLLLEHLSKNNKEVYWNSELIHIEQSTNGVQATYKNGQGIKHKIEADYLVGCDGASSPTRHQLNLAFEGSTEPKLFYVADVLINSSVINKNKLYMYMIKKGFILFFPMEGTEHYRIIGILPEHTEANYEYKFSDVESFIKEQIISPLNFVELKWFSSYRVHSRKANSFMVGRCFLVGDAAHIHTPAGGQGMNTGIQDAYNLAWKIAYTLRGEVKDGILKSYNVERMQNAKHLLETTDRMFDILSGVNPFWNFLRLNFFPWFLRALSKNKLLKQRIFPLLSQIGIAYPESYLTLKSKLGKVKAGDRMPYFIFSNGKHIFSYLTEPVFKLLCFGNASALHPGREMPIQLSVISFSEIPKQLFGDATAIFILLRPDNHISYIGKDPAPCWTLLREFSSGKTAAKSF